MIEVAAAIAGATKAYAGVKAFIEAGKSIEETFTVVARWQGHCSDLLFHSQRQKAHQPTKKISVFAIRRSGGRLTFCPQEAPGEPTKGAT